MPNPAAAYDSIIASVLASAGVAGPAEAAFAQVVAGALAPAAAAAEFPFPKQAAIRAELTNVAGNWPLVITRHLETFVLPQLRTIPATPVAGAPGAAKVAWNTAAQIDKIVRIEGAVTFTPPVTNALPLAVFDRFDFKLHQLQENPGHDIANGWTLVKEYSNAVPVKVPPSAHPSQAAALLAILNLAAFEGFCVRLSSAIRAADRADVSLAEALALWRTEGDLLAPYSEARRAAGAPTCDVIPGIHLGDQTEEVFFSMKRGLWSFTYNRFISSGLPVDAATKTQAVDALKLKALLQWSLVTAGLDFFWKRITLDFADRAASVSAIAQFLDAHHVARRGAADYKPALKADCEAILTDLECQLPLAADQRAIVAPKTPSMLVSMMLGEALILAELDTVTGRGPVVAPTPKLKYLAYHCQDHRHASEPAQDKFTLMLVSAAVAAARGPAGALRTSLAPYAADPSFPKSSDLLSLDFSGPAVTGDTSGHVAGYQKLSAGGWWDPANLDNLADFMLIASPAQWQGWEDLRGNMARYRKLRAYYDKLLS